MTPAAVMAAKGFRQSFKLAQVLDVLRDARELRSYLAGPGRSDPPEAREARIRSLFTKVTGPDVPTDSLEPVYDYFAKKIIDEWAALDESSPESP